MTTEYRQRLLSILAQIDQQIAEATALLENANMSVADWFRCSDQLSALERARQDVEARLEAAR